MDSRVTLEFCDNLLQNPLHPLDDFTEELHPFPMRMPSPIDFDGRLSFDMDFQLPTYQFDEEFNLIADDSGISHGTSIEEDSDDDEMIFPHFDFNFSLDDMKMPSIDCDDSFIKHW